MIKDLRNISQKDLDYLMSHPFTVWEKLDMFYFRVEITKIGAIPMRGSLGKVISDIDCVTNSLFKDVCEFVSTKINPIRNELIEMYGEITLGFFYLPVRTYHKISYNRLTPGTVILSDCNPFNNIKSIAGKLGVEVPPIIMEWNPSDCPIDMKEAKDAINAYIKDEENLRNDVVSVLTRDNTYGASGNYISEIEGIIIRTDKFQYQVKIKDTEDNLDKSVKLIYRDTLLKSLADYYEKNTEKVNGLIESCDSYIDKVSKLFLGYIEDTDLFTKFSFDPEDLLPPTTSYFGDIDYDMISDTNVKLICRYNEVNKNIFRLFLHTFAQKISEDKFTSLSDNTKRLLNDLTIKLKYKNYKEILLTAYKANI